MHENEKNFAASWDADEPAAAPAAPAAPAVPDAPPVPTQAPVAAPRAQAIAADEAAFQAALRDEMKE